MGGSASGSGGGSTATRALMAVEPAALKAVHWYQPEVSDVATKVAVEPPNPSWATLTSAGKA